MASKALSRALLRALPRFEAGEGGDSLRVWRPQPTSPSPLVGEGRGGGSDPRQRIKQTEMCVFESAATPTPALPHQGAGLTARRGRGKKKRIVASSWQSVTRVIF